MIFLPLEVPKALLVLKVPLVLLVQTELMELMVLKVLPVPLVQTELTVLKALPVRKAPLVLLV